MVWPCAEVKAMRKCLFFCGLLFFGLALSAQAELKKVSFLAQWHPQAQFAGYYVALDKGFYRDHGLDVTIIHGGPETSVFEDLAQGKVTFTSAFIVLAICNYSAGVPLMNVCQLVQRPASVLVAKKSSGIRSPADLNNKRVSLWRDFQFQPSVLFRKFEVQPRIIPQGASLSLFLNDGVDVVAAMTYNELHTILNSGYDADELVIFHLEDYGVKFPEDGIYCLRPTFEKDQELCRSFVIATLKGWRYALEHFDEALEITMKYIRIANLGVSRVHQRWMLQKMLENIFPNGSKTQAGYLASDVYHSVVGELKRADLIKTAPTYETFYENCTEK